VRIVLLMDAADEHQVEIEQNGFELLERTPVSLFGSWPEILVLGNKQ
jgi:hypothetical protein